MIRQASWLLLEKLLRVASGLLVSTAVARHLGPADYGLLAVAVGAIGVAVAAANMGADHVNLAELARGDAPGFLASALWVRCGWAVCCALAVWLVASGIDTSAPAAVWTALLGVVLAAAPQILTHQLYADGRFATASALAIAGVLTGAAARIAGVVLGLDLTWFAWCFTIEAVALGGGVLLWFSATDRRWRPTAVRWADARRYAVLCAPTVVSAVLVALYFRIELFVVGGVLGAEAAGTWAAAMMFILPWNMASAALLPVVNRRLMLRRPEDGPADATMLRLLRLMVVAGAGCAMVNLVAVPWVVALLLGDRYAATVTIAAIGSAALVPLFVGAVQDVSLAQRRRTGVVLRKALVGIPLSIGLLALGASQGGLAGVAVGLLVSYFITTGPLNAWLDPDFFRLQLAAIGWRRER